MKFRVFRGEMPRLPEFVLSDANGQIAENTKLWRNQLEPFRNPLSITSLAKVGRKETIWRYRVDLDSKVNYWFHMLNDTDFVSGMLTLDTQQRVYFTEAGQPMKQTDATIATADGSMPSASYLVGFPSPAKPTVGVTGSATGTAQKIAVAYAWIMTWSSFVEEGPVSPISDLIDYYPGQTLDVTAMSSVPGGAYNITGKRVYVSQFDSAGNVTLRFWKDTAAGATSTSGVLDFTLLGSGAPSPSPLAPPSDLFSLGKHPANFLFGLTPGKLFCRSDVYKGYAWPFEYRDPIEWDPVAAVAMGQSVVIGTRGHPYIAVGNDPLNIQPRKLPGKFPCVSKRSMKVLGVGTVYASGDGLVAVTPDGGVELVTSGLYTRDQWQAYKPESMHAEVHDNRYYCWWEIDSGNRGLLIFDFTGEGAGVVRSPIYATAAFSDPRRDAMFIALPADNNLYEWDAGATYATLKWRSKRYVMLGGAGYSAAIMNGDFSGGRTATLRVYGDQGQGAGMELIASRTFSASMVPGRLALKRCFQYEFEIEGTAWVKWFDLGGSMADLSQQ